MDGDQTTHGRESVFATTPKTKGKVKMDSGLRRNDEGAEVAFRGNDEKKKALGTRFRGNEEESEPQPRVNSSEKALASPRNCPRTRH